MFRLLLTEPLDVDTERRLEAGATVVRPPDLAEATLCQLVVDCDAIVVRSRTRLTRAVLAAGQRLRVVGVAGVGVDRVDTKAADELNIRVLNRPGAATEAVADLTIALMLNLLRPIRQLEDAARAGQFSAARHAPHGCELNTLTIGIVGMGRIGSRVGRILSAGFGCRVLYNDIAPVGPFDFPAEAVDKLTLWSTADIVTLHVPLTEQTRGLVDTEVLRHFRPGARLINTSRGAVVDGLALAAALEGGRLAGAALDVTDPEPLSGDHPLLKCQGCIITPHIAARTYAGLRRMAAVADDVLAWLRDESAGRTSPKS